MKAMQAMLHLFASMPGMVFIAVCMLLRSKPKYQLTTCEIHNRILAIVALANALPVPQSQLGILLSNRVLDWLHKEINALSVLDRLNGVTTGTVPMFHVSSIERRN